MPNKNVTPTTRYFRNARSKGLQSDGSAVCVNVKLYNGPGLDDDAYRRIAREHTGTDTLPDGTVFDAQYVAEADSDGYWTEATVESEMEQAREMARTLFGSDPDDVGLYGRSGGWLVVLGLPDVERWEGLKVGDACPNCDALVTAEELAAGLCVSCDRYYPSPFELPKITGSDLDGATFEDGTPLADSTSLLDRWRFFEECAARTVESLPENIAQLVAINKWQRDFDEQRKEAAERAALLAAEQEATKLAAEKEEERVRMRRSLERIAGLTQGTPSVLVIEAHDEAMRGLGTESVAVLLPADAWIPVGEKLPPRSYTSRPYGGISESVPVLATDGKIVRVAALRDPYCDMREHSDEPPRWIIEGRDAYTFEGVTHWRPLPPLP